LLDYSFAKIFGGLSPKAIQQKESLIPMLGLLSVLQRLVVTAKNVMFLLAICINSGVKCRFIGEF
jgi:hypothetical protein